jgi:hypothetical protein
MNGATFDPALGKVSNGVFDSFRHVKKLKIHKHLFSTGLKRLHEFPVALGHKQLEPDFVKGHRVPEAVHPFKSLRTGG